MAETQPKVAPGDWVRFYKAGALVVGVVQYLRPDPFTSWKTQVSTDIGTVDVDAILECRSAALDRVRDDARTVCEFPDLERAIDEFRAQVIGNYTDGSFESSREEAIARKNLRAAASAPTGEKQ